MSPTERAMAAREGKRLKDAPQKPGLFTRQHAPGTPSPYGQSTKTGAFTRNDIRNAPGATRSEKKAALRAVIKQSKQTARYLRAQKAAEPCQSPKLNPFQTESSI